MEELYVDKAIEQLGYKCLVIAMEEIAEVQMAIETYMFNGENIDNLHEEIADTFMALMWIRAYKNLKFADFGEIKTSNLVYDLKIGLSELQQLVSKEIRGKGNRDDIVCKCSSIEQLLNLFILRFGLDNNEISRWYDYKKNRIIDRLSNGMLD